MHNGRLMNKFSSQTAAHFADRSIYLWQMMDTSLSTTTTMWRLIKLCWLCNAMTFDIGHYRTKRERAQFALECTLHTPEHTMTDESEIAERERERETERSGHFKTMSKKTSGAQLHNWTVQHSLTYSEREGERERRAHWERWPERLQRLVSCLSWFSLASLTSVHSHRMHSERRLRHSSYFAEGVTLALRYTHSLSFTLHCTLRNWWEWLKHFYFSTMNMTIIKRTTSSILFYFYHPLNCSLLCSL